MNGLSILVGGAGASIGTEYVLVPFFSHFELKAEQYKIDLSSLRLDQFVTLFNNIGADYVSTKATPLEAQLWGECNFLLVVKNKNFVSTFTTSMPGALCLGKRSSFAPGEVENLSGVGSGSRYVLGAWLANYKLKNYKQWQEKEVIEWVRTYFSSCIDLDMASSVQSGLNLELLYFDDRPLSSHSF